MKKWVYGLICILCAAALQAQSAGMLLKQAANETDPAKQVRILTQAIAKNPKSALAFHRRADAYRQLGQLKPALQDYTRALLLTPQDPFRYYARALAYLDNKQYALAEADLTKAISLKKNYSGFYLQRAHAYMALDKYAPAIADYKKYLAKNSKTPDISLHLAQAYIKTYQYPRAEAEINYLQETQPDAPDSYFLRGRILHNQNKLDEAVSYYSKAINRDPAYAQAYRYRASAFKDMGELEVSAQDYTELIALLPEPIFYNRRGLVYEEMQQWDKAIEDYSKTIELSPKWPIAYNNRGYVYLKQKKYQAARKDFETAIELDDSLPTPYINLAGLSWLQKKDRRQVYRYLDKALKRHFRDFESLYDQDRKGWMFAGINHTSEFRAVMYK